MVGKEVRLLEYSDQDQKGSKGVGCGRAKTRPIQVIQAALAVSR
jgi:hypothetical protein